MNQKNNNNNNNKKKEGIIRSSNKNIIQSPIDLEHRYCKKCNLHLVPSKTDMSIFVCPTCNVAVTMKDTYPNVKLRTTFPVFNPTDIPNRKHVMQSSDEKLPRSELFFKKRQIERNKIEDNDPYLKQLKQNNQIRITNVEYYDPEPADYYDREY